MENQYLALMNKSISRLAWNAARLALRYPSCLSTFYRLARYQKSAAYIRSIHRAHGTTIPAFMIISITRRCNLSCRGCYSHASLAREQIEGRGEELDMLNLARIVREGADLGVSFMLIAGGEPLVRAQEIFAFAKENPSVVFPVFTNGTLIDDAIISDFKKCRNVVPILSIEGGIEFTDDRRGSGIYENAVARMRALKKAGIFFGVSFTVMKHTVSEILSPVFIASLIDAGAGIFFYNEYTPINEGNSELCISADERAAMLASLEGLRSQFKRIFLAFPGDEDKFGGCLSSGRGFAHIAPDGRVEACPFAPFGDSSALDASLATALRSPLLAAIRSHQDELHETSGGCALWNRREWVESLIVKPE